MDISNQAVDRFIWFRRRRHVIFFCHCRIRIWYTLIDIRRQYVVIFWTIIKIKVLTLSGLRGPDLALTLLSHTTSKTRVLVDWQWNGFQHIDIEIMKPTSAASSYVARWPKVRIKQRITVYPIRFPSKSRKIEEAIMIMGKENLNADELCCFPTEAIEF